MQTTFAFKYILIQCFKRQKISMIFAKYPSAQSKTIGSVSWYAFIMVSQIPDQLKYEFLPLSYFGCSPIDVMNDEGEGNHEAAIQKIMSIWIFFMNFFFFVKSIRRGKYAKSYSTVTAPFVNVIFKLFSFI